jgi:hypothetical protein
VAFVPALPCVSQHTLPESRLGIKGLRLAKRDEIRSPCRDFGLELERAELREVHAEVDIDGEVPFSPRRR